MMVIPKEISALGTVPKGLEKGLEELEIPRRIIGGNGHNTEKSPGDL